MNTTRTIFKSYLKNNEDWRTKWNSITYENDFSFNHEHYRDELTPFYGMNDFDALTDKQKHNLFFDYVKLISEAQILLEQILIYGFYYFREKVNKLNNPELEASVLKLAKEELIHSQAYRDFLAANSIFSWPERKIFPKHSSVRKFMAIVIKRAPLGMTLPGAKIEAFSLAYFNMLKKIYGAETKDNSWFTLNEYHHADEIYHVPLEFDIYNSTIKTAGPLKSLCSTIIFVLFLQYTLFTGAYVIIKNNFTDLSFPQRMKKVMRFIKWAVRYMPAYQETRTITKSQFKNKKPMFKNILKFIYW